MEKKGSLMADRPRAVAAGEILSRGLRLIFAPAGQQMLQRVQGFIRPGALIETYPFLRYVPGYASYIEEWRKEERQLFHDQLNRVARELVGLLVTGSKLLMASAIEIW